MYRPGCGPVRGLHGLLCLSLVGWLFTIVLTYAGFACMVAGGSAARGPRAGARCVPPPPASSLAAAGSAACFRRPPPDRPPARRPAGVAWGSNLHVTVRQAWRKARRSN